jgi:hypothetical protein
LRRWTAWRRHTRTRARSRRRTGRSAACGSTSPRHISARAIRSLRGSNRPLPSLPPAPPGLMNALRPPMRLLAVGGTRCGREHAAWQGVARSISRARRRRPRCAREGRAAKQQARWCRRGTGAARTRAKTELLSAAAPPSGADDASRIQQRSWACGAGCAARGQPARQACRCRRQPARTARRANVRPPESVDGWAARARRHPLADIGQPQRRRPRAAADRGDDARRGSAPWRGGEGQLGLSALAVVILCRQRRADSARRALRAWVVVARPQGAWMQRRHPSTWWHQRGGRRDRRVASADLQVALPPLDPPQEGGTR